MSKTEQNAIDLIKEYEAIVTKQEAEIADYTKKMEPFQTKFKEQTSEIQSASLIKLNKLELDRKAIEEKLLKIGAKELEKLNAKKPSKFQDDNWKFEGFNHYLHVSRETVVETSKDFELWKFVKRFGNYAEVKFKIKELKKVFTDTDLVRPFTKIGFKLKTNNTVELKKSKAQ